MFDVPKLILTVVFLEKFQVRFNIIKLDEFFTLSSKNKKHFISSTDLVIHQEECFDINRNYLTLPMDYRFELPVIMTFKSDVDRYDFLNDLRISLVEWSRSIYWTNVNKIFSKEAKLKFNKNIWVLY